MLSMVLEVSSETNLLVFFACFHKPYHYNGSELEKTYWEILCHEEKTGFLLKARSGYNGYQVFCRMYVNQCCFYIKLHIQPIISQK